MRISSEPTRKFPLIYGAAFSVLFWQAIEDFYQRLQQCCRCLARFYCVQYLGAAYHQSSAFTELQINYRSENNVRNILKIVPKSLLNIVLEPNGGYIYL